MPVFTLSRHNTYLSLTSHKNVNWKLDNNPFLTGKDVAREVWNDLWDNHFSISQSYTTLKIQVANVQTLVLRNDIWGLFGETEKEPKHTVSAIASSFFHSGESQIEIYLPKKEIRQKQIP